jgi:hypothetical protein
MFFSEDNGHRQEVSYSIDELPILDPGNSSRLKRNSKIEGIFTTMFGFALLGYVATATAYVWPSPKLDALEAQRWDQDDTLSGFASFVQPCDFFIRGNDDGSPTGRANGPDWIRTVRRGPRNPLYLTLICE